MRKLRKIGLGLLLVACGSRTGLPIDDVESIEAEDSGIRDASNDRDASVPLPDGDVTFDALPPIDVAPIPDVVRNDCPDADATLIYVMTDANQLFSFDPSGGGSSFNEIGVIACPTTGNVNGNPPTPFSMAVNRKGIAYVVFNDGELFRVSTATAACTTTSFQPQPDGDSFHTFGMSFSTDLLGPSETLFIASDSSMNGSGTLPQLGSIDTTSFKLSVVGAFNPTLDDAELAGTGDGRLFAFFPDGVPTATFTPASSYIGEIEKTTGNVTAKTFLPDVSVGSGWAFGYWGGDLYLFTAPGDPQQVNSSIVQRYRPSDGTTTTIGNISATIVGAGVSTCAPQQ